MPIQSGLGAYTLRVQKEGPIGFTAVSRDTYVLLLNLLKELPLPKFVFRPPVEHKIPQSNVPALVTPLAELISVKRRPQCHVLLIELLDTEPDEYEYDDLCEAIHDVIRMTGVVLPWCITIAVSNGDVFEDSVVLKHRLVPECRLKNVGLILLSLGASAKPKVLCQGALSVVGDLPELGSSKASSPEHYQSQLSTEEIAKLFQSLFGHFEIQIGGSIFHIPCVASVRRLAHTADFVSQLKYDVSNLIATSHYAVLPFGLQGGGIDELSLGLVEGDATRVARKGTEVSNLHCDSIVILCDFLSQHYPLANEVERIKKSGITKLGVVGIGRFLDAPILEGIPTLWYLDHPYKSIAVGKTVCPFCEQGVIPIACDHFDAFARALNVFEPFTFWEFVSQREDFLRVGHWASDRTPNHYHFRIITDPVFRLYSYGLSIRLKNALQAKGILPGWIGKIVCTDGEESFRLSIALAEVLGLRDSDVIAIPRKFFASIAGKEIDTDLQKHIESSYGENQLRHSNVVIVDQAAHHFKTLSALKNICEYYDSVVLAFAVFIDRTNSALWLGEYLHDTHYVPLYSWPVSPRRAYECACTGSKRT